MDKAIEIKNMSKIYDLGLVGTGTLSKDLNRIWAKMRNKPDPYATIAELNDRTRKSKSGTIYALRDINLSVVEGEVLGIIGKNGAGKSTLLKILSEITSPSFGHIKMKGRIASLLEVGTGMHPEMTARQNIFLNGSLLGMKKSEIKAKFDEIIDFAGILKYIDTPIKRFSSGMQVRLGFSIAAFLEPEILIVDEVLAVGDAEFQKKAIGKMKSIANQKGRTVLFVSHNMSSVSNLCSKALIMENGSISEVGETNKIVTKYLNPFFKTENNRLNLEERSGNGLIKFKNAKIHNGSENIRSFSDFTISLEIEKNTNISFKNIRIDIGINNDFGQRISWLSTSLFEFNVSKNKLNFDIKKSPLAPGKYSLTLYCESNGVIEDWLPNAISFMVRGDSLYLNDRLNNKNKGDVILNYKIS